VVTAPATTRSTPGPQALTRRLARPTDPLWAAISVVASVLILVAAFLPLWQLELVAPQYPNGLFITAYGYKMTGDISEINGLNHYVGLRPVEPETVTELKLFPFGVAAVVAVILVGAYRFRSRRARLLSVLAAAALPVVTLAILQYWLYVFGHDIDPRAALTLEPFTPKVLGSTRVMNFHSVTTLAPGMWLMVASAVLLLVGAPLLRWLAASWNNTGKAAAVAAALAVIVSTTAGAPHPMLADGESIAAAIARAAPGDTVRIGPGVYRETLVIDRPVVLVGEGMPVIDAGQQGDVVLIVAEGVTIRGFVLQGSGRGVVDEPAGVRVTANRATIEGNEIRNVLYGIVLSGSNGHVVRDNHVESVREFAQERRGNAIYLHNSHRNVIDNNVVMHAKDGILLLFSDDTQITRNAVTESRYGIHFMYAKRSVMAENRLTNNVNGAVLMYSTGAEFRDNVLAHNRSLASGYGLMFKDVDDVTITGNLVHHNRVGVALEGAPFTPGSFVRITDNFIGHNQTAVGLFTTTDVTFSGNTFAGNLRQVDAVAGSVANKNQWSDGGRGNYWDDYQGYDATSDGIGDLPYRYAGAYDALVQKNEALRAYDYTPAQMALDLGARWFPAYRPEPRAVDEHPLMAPTVSLPPSGEGAGRAWLAAAALGLVAGPLAALRRLTTASRRRWARC
jgi:nitrous oxidase accessory protein